LENIWEIKAKDEEEAKQIAIDQYKIESGSEIIVEELKKSKNIFGFIKSDGLYRVTVKINNLKAEIKEKADKLISLMGLNLSTEVIPQDKNLYKININGVDNGIVIGKKGKTLNNFEYLLNYMVRGARIDVDVEEFKEKREQTLRELAQKMVEKVIITDKAVKLNPMPPRERRIIHEVVNQFEDKGIDTYSEGKDPNRYIVIRKKKQDADV
jgi:spoIIIJ-associated protein